MEFPQWRCWRGWLSRYVMSCTRLYLLYWQAHFTPLTVHIHTPNASAPMLCNLSSYSFVIGQKNREIPFVIMRAIHRYALAVVFQNFISEVPWFTKRIQLYVLVHHDLCLNAKFWADTSNLLRITFEVRDFIRVLCHALLPTQLTFQEKIWMLFHLKAFLRSW